MIPIIAKDIKNNYYNYYKIIFFFFENANTLFASTKFFNNNE